MAPCRNPLPLQAQIPVTVRFLAIPDAGFEPATSCLYGVYFWLKTLSATEFCECHAAVVCDLCAACPRIRFCSRLQTITLRAVVAKGKLLEEGCYFLFGHCKRAWIRFEI